MIWCSFLNYFFYCRSWVGGESGFRGNRRGGRRRVRITVGFAVVLEERWEEDGFGNCFRGS